MSDLESRIAAAGAADANERREAAGEESLEAGGIEIVFRPDPHVWDGRFTNNAWLQELPQPTTRLTWGNAALVSPRLAEQLGLSDGDVVEIEIATDSHSYYQLAINPAGALVDLDRGAPRPT